MARGYQLAQGNEARPVKPLTVVGVAAKASVEQGLEAALESALAHWLYHDEVWADSAAAKREPGRWLAYAMRWCYLAALCRESHRPQLRESLTEAEAALDGGEAEAALFNPRHGWRQTAADRMAGSTRGWRSFLNEAGQKKIAGSFKRFADIQLSKAAAELKATQQTQDDYSDRLTRLAREIDSIQLLQRL